MALLPCWAPLGHVEAGGAWCPQPLVTSRGHSSLRGAARPKVMVLDADVAQPELEMTECPGGKNKLGFQFLWKRHLFAEELTSEPGPCAWGGGWTLEGKVLCLLPGALPGLHV